jgi:hypothetical protein
MNTSLFTKDTDVEMYISLAIELIEAKNKPTERIKLEGIMRYHNKSCLRQEQCFCWKIVQVDLDKIEEVVEESVDYKNWYTFLSSIISEGLEKFPKSSRLHLY